jgi:hypothetical protein
VIKVFDFSDPMTLPLKEIEEIELLGNDEIISEWLDNETFKTKGIKRERVRVYDRSGGFSTKTISEEAVERRIKIKQI